MTFHQGNLAYLEKLADGKASDEEPKDKQSTDKKSGEASPQVGEKRPRPHALHINAILKSEINTVELAFLERPSSPTFKIHSDK